MVRSVVQVFNSSPNPRRQLLPIYSALAFVGELSGGSTRPWAILASDTNGKVQKLAVKLFRDYHFRQYAAVANEVFGTVLANQFELQCPESVLVEFSQDFIGTLNEPQRDQLSAVPDGLKVGSIFLEGSFPYSPALEARFLEPYDLETIYAFDNLILNVDRRPDKPNILFRGSEVYLIDHEMTLEGIPGAMRQLNAQNWEHHYRGHLFYQYLRSRSPDRIAQSFHTFSQYLQGLNVRCLDPYQDQLHRLGLGYHRFDELGRYLCYQKANFSQFETLLKKTLL